MLPRFDAVIVGAGAAGLFCAGVAAQRGLRVALIDHSERLAEKIRISGGGRCNFTNLEADRPERFISRDPRFARHALRAYRPDRFIALMQSYGISWHEKHRGQLFCDDSSERVIEMLRTECDRGGVHWLRPCAVQEVAQSVASGFKLHTDAGEIACTSLVIASGGLSIPKIGATDWGLRLARQFGLEVIEPRPALVPLTFTAQSCEPFSAWSGLALEVDLSLPERPDAPRFREDLLFTHRGLSGPAILQGSSYWQAGEPVAIDLAPGRDLGQALTQARDGTRQQLGTVLSAVVPKRLAQAWLADAGVAALVPAAPGGAAVSERRIAELGNRTLQALASRFKDWRIQPAGTEGWRKAEVTAGGVATAELDPKSLQAHRIPGLYFIGEVVDVTGWLGGYNFQWAWASGWCAAQALPNR